MITIEKKIIKIFFETANKLRKNVNFEKVFYTLKMSPHSKSKFKLYCEVQTNL